VIGLLAANGFDAEIVDDRAKLESLRDVAPEAVGAPRGEIAVLGRDP
jgi:hypothetical protein